MAEKVSGRILTRIVGLCEPIMVSVYTGVWIYTDWHDPKNMGQESWRKNREMSSEVTMIFVRNVLSVIMSFICAPLLIVATCNFMRAKWRLLACKTWCFLKVLIICYWFYGLWREYYEIDAYSIVPIIVMLIEIAIVYYYVINFMFTVMPEEDDLDDIVDLQSTDLNNVGNQSNL